MPAVTKDVRILVLNTVTSFPAHFCILILVLNRGPLKQKRTQGNDLSSFTKETTLVKILENVDWQMNVCIIFS